MSRIGFQRNDSSTPYRVNSGNPRGLLTTLLHDMIVAIFRRLHVPTNEVGHEPPAID